MDDRVNMHKDTIPISGNRKLYHFTFDGEVTDTTGLRNQPNTHEPVTEEPKTEQEPTSDNPSPS